MVFFFEVQVEAQFMVSYIYGYVVRWVRVHVHLNRPDADPFQTDSLGPEDPI